MSKYIEVQTTLTDQSLLVEALQFMGYKPVIHNLAVALLGVSGDVRKETAEVIIPRKQVGGASNEIGFKLQSNGCYVRISSEFDNGQGRLSQQKLVQNYAKAGVLKHARDTGLTLIETSTVEGEMQFTFEPAYA